MKPDLQRRIQRYGWDKASSYYNSYWAKQLEPAQQLLLEMAALAAGERILDVACGTGLVTFPAAVAVGSDGSVMATDLSDEMVAAAQTEVDRRCLANVTIRRMDAENLDFEDCSFDVALCGLGLMYVPDPAEALAEMHRVLEIGARAVSAVWGLRALCGWAEIFPIVDSRVKSEVCPMFFHLGAGGAQQLAFEAAGFERVESRRIITVLKYESEEEALGAAFAGGPVALSYARFDEDVRQEAHAEYLKSIEPYRREGGYDIPGEFVVTRGWKSGPRTV